jgi:hypothetical protein
MIFIFDIGQGQINSVYALLNSLLVPLGGYGRFAALKTYNKELKTMLAIGGWNEGSKRFSPLVEDPVRRRTFIRFVSTATKIPFMYSFFFWELRGLCPNFRIHVSVSDSYIPRICPHCNPLRVS